MEETEDLFDIAKSLGLSKNQIVETRITGEVVSTGLPVVIVPVRTLTAVRSIMPDAAAITEVCERFGANGIMVFTTITVEDHATVHTRMFAPAIGILEDPATGQRERRHGRLSRAPWAGGGGADDGNHPRAGL